MSPSADIVFALPKRPRTAVLLGGPDGFEQALARIGVRRLDPRRPGKEAPDLVVASGATIEEATAHGSPAVIAEGGGSGRRLSRAGYETRRFLPFPDLAATRILLPLSSPRPLRYAIHRGPPARPLKRLRNGIAAAALSRGLRLPRSPLLSVGVRDPGLPFLVAEARRRLGLPDDVDWVLFPATGDVLSRGAFHIFAPGESEPSWILKFARVPGYSESFERDERGLGIARSCGPAVAAHAPRLLGSLELDGLHASLETAVVGRPLAGYLRSGATRPARLRVIDRIAGWLVELGVATAVAPERLDAERDRIRADVLPPWGDLGAAPSLVDDIPPVPGVLQHNDLGTWNIVVAPPSTEGSFGVLDWEDASRVGMPLWDLLHFLQHALAQLDGASGLSEQALSEREAHAVRLFRGELPASATLFAWTRRMVSACAIPDRAVGPLATLCFLHHGLSQSAREGAVRDHDAGRGTIETLAPRFARRWLTDPGLGPGWDRWR